MENWLGVLTTWTYVIGVLCWSVCAAGVMGYGLYTLGWMGTHVATRWVLAARTRRPDVRRRPDARMGAPMSDLRPGDTGVRSSVLPDTVTRAR